MFIAPSDAATIFSSKFQNTIAEISETSKSDVTESEQENNTCRTSWNRNKIIELINLYKCHEHLFKSTTIRKDKVWDMTAQKLPTHITEQIKNKFKYLKQKYLEKKDNMSYKSSGASGIKFDYFNKMDDIFGQDPDVHPVSTASSLQGIQLAAKTSSIEKEESSCNTDEEMVTKKSEKLKIKKSKSVKQRIYEQNYKDREAKKEKRRNELIAQQDAALQILKDIAVTFANLSNIQK
ncbi:hypothetical protein PUN28_008816 [Cardiocondyla obscurior]|uniref:Myb/SANT-like DNA-binding domain-containing protein n=1 Tax=Cardiocondyla obscurior TaxID=286306 RepID=A0AAW2FR43_9HYME